jgi:hypothetical protein
MHNFRALAEATGGSGATGTRRAANRLFAYEPKVEGNQKEREVNEAAYSQEFGRYRKSNKRDTDLIPPKIPARASRYKKRTGEKFTDLFPNNAHNPTLPR